jgi:protein involved in sex pheromone biosynthesis
MKNIIIGLAIAATILSACNNSNNKNTDAKQDAENKDTSMVTQPSAMHDTASTQTTSVFPAKEIIAGYLQLKNALAKDNGQDAATAGNAIVATLAKVDMKSLSDVQMKSYMNIADDLKEHAEHIGANPGKIEHQREHFIMLSKDMADFIKAFGNGGQTLYRDFCPMANDSKGATWISEVKEIKNPYLGSKMPDCGSVKETIK